MNAAATTHRRLVSLEVCAEHFDINARTLRRHIAAGKVPAYRIGRLLKIDLAEAEAALLRRIPTARVTR